jgi:hypothetical protein
VCSLDFSLIADFRLPAAGLVQSWEDLPQIEVSARHGGRNFSVLRTVADMEVRFSTTARLLQLYVLRFRLSQDGNISVGVFPEGKEVLVGRFRLGGVALHGISSTQLPVR